MKTKILIFLAFSLCFLTTLTAKPAFADPPSASFTFTASGLTVDFDASSSSDPDGPIASYSWDFGDSSPNGSGVTPSHTYATAGTYTVTLTVTDSDTLIDTDTQTITLNSPPVANAGSDQSVFVGDTVTLDGSGSSDVDGDSLTYSWSFTSRPLGSTATLSDPSAVKPTFDVDEFGDYVVQLIVNDGTVDSAPDSVTISTLNSPPVANAGPDQSVFVGDTVTLDGSGSSDVDGDSLTYSWSFTSRPPGSTTTLSDPTAVNPTFDVDVFGTYVVQLIVNDGAVNSAPDSVTISTLNSPPVANAGPDQSVFVGDTVTLDGSGSSDVDGDSLTYFWSITSRPLGSTATLSDPSAVKPTFDVDEFGDYVVQLIVNDGTVNSAPDSVTISTLNSPPVANAGPDQSVFVGDTVTLDGSGSSDVDGDSLTFAWSFVSIPAGSTATLSDPSAVKPTFDVDEFGDYVVQLIVNDGTVNSAPDSVTINTLNSAPVADAGPDQTPFVTDTVTLDGSGSSDVDGDPLTYSWSFTSRPPGSTTTLSDPTAVNPTFFVDVFGTYVVQLIVNDGTVNSAPDSVTIDTLNSAPVADAGPDQTPFVTDTVTLDGSGSSDVDGDPLTYSWSFTSRPPGSSTTLFNPTLANPTFVVDKFGTYVVQLIVNDGTVNSAPDSVTIDTLNSAPVANAVLEPPPAGQVFVGDTATLDGSGSSDVDDHPLTFQWSFTSRPPGSSTTLSNPTAVNPTFDVDVVGTYGIQLIVNDGRVDSDPPASLNVVTGNFLPIADAGPDQSPLEKSSVVLDGSNSSDKDDGIQSYSWVQVVGPRVTLSDGDTVQASFTAPELQDNEEITIITFMLTVTDAGGQKATDSTDVTVNNFEKKNPGASGGGCFIATATYGSSTDYHVNLPREFRDRFLIINPLGEEFLKLYYTYSPTLADLVAKHETLRKVVRFSLLPFAAMAYVMLYLGAETSMLSLATLLIILIFPRIALAIKKSGSK